MFKKKAIIQNEGSPKRAIHGTVINEKISNHPPVENKHIFKIEEDEEAKEYSYNLNDLDSDEEDDDYEENESEEEKEKEKVKEKEKEKDKENSNEINKKENEQSNNITGTNSIQDAEENLNEEDYDLQNISHRIYYKVSIQNIINLIFLLLGLIY